MREEKGSVTLFVLIACIFMITILLIINVGIMNKNRNQEKSLEEIAKQYNQNEIDLNSTYEETAETNISALISQIINTMYPVGSIYITTNEQNPGEYLGGKWESYGEGRTIVGAGTGTDSNNTQKIFGIGEEGGEYTHTLSLSEIPSHVHSLSSGTISTASLVGYIWNYVVQSSDNPGSASGIVSKYKMDSTLRTGSTGTAITANDGLRINASHNHTIGGNSGSQGGNGKHNNIQPYIVTYMWKRVS